MVRGRFVFCAIISVGFFGCGTNRTMEFKIPVEAASQRNPFPATSDSIAEGNELYRSAGYAIRADVAVRVAPGPAIRVTQPASVCPRPH